jgi:hypothetical protein
MLHCAAFNLWFPRVPIGNQESCQAEDEPRSRGRRGGVNKTHVIDNSNLDPTYLMTNQFYTSTLCEDCIQHSWWNLQKLDNAFHDIRNWQRTFNNTVYLRILNLLSHIRPTMYVTLETKAMDSQKTTFGHWIPNNDEIRLTDNTGFNKTDIRIWVHGARLIIFRITTYAVIQTWPPQTTEIWLKS